MDGYDLQMYYACVSKCKNLKFDFSVKGKGIEILTDSGNMVGAFETIRDVFNFLCGVELGIDIGKISVMRSMAE